ncbi:MAG: phosphopentomutase [Erysipelotrichaceae bacterium]|nr:phosphopentomutase [Erysipelotrichaceae bacterium]MDD3808710.1 phosphopentomutase [Erysipelotrichaceae bacterium]
MKFKRIFLIVADSLGVGNAPDAMNFGDQGANTLKHIVANEDPDTVNLIQLEGMGLGSLGEFNGIYRLTNQLGYSAVLEEKSNAKDTLTGHHEMMGLISTKGYKTFTDTGFPDEFIKLFEEKTGRKCVGNISISGTTILEQYGEHQKQTGDWIVYTSADSVFQIAANEDVIKLEELYRACKIARELLMKDEWKVARVIARPFKEASPGKFVRTPNRHDYALSPAMATMLDYMKQANFDVISVGKISDIFNGQGITKSIPTISNNDGMNKIVELAHTDFTGLVFANLVDFDSLYGHRRDSKGYLEAIKEFDSKLGDLIGLLKNDDLLIITADHGNDPTWTGTDHTRENVPLLMYSKQLKGPRHLGQFCGFDYIGNTIGENFNIPEADKNKSFFEILI